MVDDSIGEYFASLVRDGDFGSLVTYDSVMSSLNLKNGKNAGVGRFEERGFSVEIERNGVWAFGYSSKIDKEELYSVVKKLNRKLDIIKYRLPVEMPEIAKYEDHVKSRWPWDPRSEGINDKVSQLDKLGRKVVNSKDIRMDISYTDRTYDVQIFNTVGSNISYSSAYPSLNVNMFSNSNAESSFLNGFIGYNEGKNLLCSDEAEILVEILEKKMHEMELNKVRIKTGKYDVVLDHNAAATLLHESLGHMSEADVGDTQVSVLKKAVGTEILEDPIDLFDDPSIEGLYGSYPYDMEGIKTRPKTLLEKGIRKEYIHNIETASHFGVEPNGGARSGTYTNRCIPRMSNLYVRGGTYGDEIIEEMHDGIMLFGSRRANVDRSTGNFTLLPSYARLVSSGELGGYAHVSYLSGNVFDVLSSIDAVGKETEVHTGFCSKSGSLSHWSAGNPRIRIKGANIYV